MGFIGGLIQVHPLRVKGDGGKAALLTKADWLPRIVMAGGNPGQPNSWNLANLPSFRCLKPFVHLFSDQTQFNGVAR
jgi:hypothetical protein